MKVCFISNSLVREREIMDGLNKKTNFLLVYPYYSSENATANDVHTFCKDHNVDYIFHDFENRRASSLLGLFKDISLVRKIKRFNPDVIYIENLGSPYLALLYRLVFGNKKIIISMMDYKLHQRSKGSFKFSERFYKSVQLNFYKFFHFFSYSQRELFDNDFPKKKSFVIRIYLVGTDLPKKEVNKDEKSTNFLFFGRIFYYKGVDVLLKAVNMLSEKYSNFKVTIAGSSDDWETEYQPLITNDKNLDLQLRYVAKEELPDLFQMADFFIAPYREVTQSGPLLRAYNYNLIPITSDEKGFLEYVNDGKNGFLFKNESPEGLMLAMEKAITISEEKKTEIINNILEFKDEEFNIDKVIEKYIQMFNEVIHSK